MHQVKRLIEHIECNFVGAQALRPLAANYPRDHVCRDSRQAVRHFPPNKPLVEAYPFKFLFAFNLKLATYHLKL